MPTSDFSCHRKQDSRATACCGDSGENTPLKTISVSTSSSADWMPAAMVPASQAQALVKQICRLDALVHLVTATTDGNT